MDDTNAVLYRQEPFVRDFEKSEWKLQEADSLTICQTKPSGEQLHQSLKLYPLKAGSYAFTGYFRESLSGGLLSGQSVNTQGFMVLHEKYRDCAFTKEDIFPVDSSGYLTLCFKTLQNLSESDLAKTRKTEENPWYIPQNQYEAFFLPGVPVFPYKSNHLVADKRRYIHVPAKIQMGVILPIPDMAGHCRISLKRNAAEETVGVKIFFY